MELLLISLKKRSQGHSWKLGMKELKATHSVSWCSPVPLFFTPFTLRKTEVHSFIQQVFAESLLNVRPSAQACTHALARAHNPPLCLGAQLSPAYSRISWL
jgi:hypothetical protein